MTSPPRIAVMISGGGRTLETLADAIKDGKLNAQIALVVASRECPGAEKARRRGLATQVIEGEIDANDLERVMRSHEIQWIVLGGYIRLIHIPAFYRGRVVNIHPALLPEFGGPGMYGHLVHEAVLASGARQSGCTVHLCDEAYDRGPILVQARCPVLEDDTPEALAARVFELERELYPRAIEGLLSGQMEPWQPGVRMERS